MTYETLRWYAYVNDKICRQPIRGVVVAFFGFGNQTRYTEDPVVAPGRQIQGPEGRLHHIRTLLGQGAMGPHLLRRHGGVFVHAPLMLPLPGGHHPAADCR